MDWEVTLQVKTCSKGPNSRQGKPPVVNIFYGGKRSKKGAKLTSSSRQDTMGGGCLSQYSFSVILEIVYMNQFINM